MHLLPVSLSPLADVCAKESGRYAATGVSLAINSDNTFTAAATDGRRLIRVIGDCIDPAPVVKDSDGNNTAAPYPSLDALSSAPNGECASIVGAKDWKKAFGDAEKLTKRARKPILRSVPVVIGKDVTTFGATDLDRVMFAQPRNVDGRFPNFEQVLPKSENAYASVTVDPALMASTLTALVKLNTSDTCAVTLELHGAADSPGIVAFRSSCTDWKIDACMVPLCNPDGSTTRTYRSVETVPDEPKTRAYRKLQTKMESVQQERDAHALKIAELEKQLENRDADLLETENARLSALKNPDGQDDLLARIADLETELADAHRAREADEESEYAKLKDRAESAESDLASYDKDIAESGYDSVKELAGAVLDLEAQLQDAINAKEHDGLRLTQAWHRIEAQQNVNALLRGNIDGARAKLARIADTVRKFSENRDSIAGVVYQLATSK